MYAGAVAVPLMIGDDWASQKKLLRCSLARISFAGDRHIIAMYRYRPLYGDPPAVIMSVTFAAVTPMIAIGMNPISACWGSLVPLSPRVLSPHFSATYRSLDAFIPATGYRCGITSIGLSIIQVGIDWAAGGKGIRNMVIPFI